MLTVLIETRNDEEGLARTLASLVPAAVEGVVQDVIICDRGSTDATQKVADSAGCIFLSDADIQAALKSARADWVLLLEPGARMMDNWMEPLMNHAGKNRSPARFRQAETGRSGFFTRFFSSSRPLKEGLVMTRQQALALSSKAKTLDALARGLASKRLTGKIQAAPD